MTVKKNEETDVLIKNREMFHINQDGFVSLNLKSQATREAIREQFEKIKDFPVKAKR